MRQMARARTGAYAARSMLRLSEGARRPDVNGIGTLSHLML
jgi:hypothetical protein